MFPSRLAQLESDVADLRTELGKLVKGDGGASGEDYRMRLSERRCGTWLNLLGGAMVIIALAGAFGWI